MENRTFSALFRVPVSAVIQRLQKYNIANADVIRFE